AGRAREQPGRPARARGRGTGEACRSGRGAAERGAPRGGRPARRAAVRPRDLRLLDRPARSGSPVAGGKDPLMPYDVKKDLKQLYAPKNTDWALVDVPEQRFLAVDGRGNPNTAESYVRAVGALYAVAYTIKMTAKRTGGDFVVGPLEGLWWADDMAAFTV